MIIIIIIIIIIIFKEGSRDYVEKGKQYK